jgi:hypothetical protein
MHDDHCSHETHHVLSVSLFYQAQLLFSFRGVRGRQLAGFDKPVELYHGCPSSGIESLNDPGVDYEQVEQEIQVCALLRCLSHARSVSRASGSTMCGCLRCIRFGNTYACCRSRSAILSLVCTAAAAICGRK